MNLLLDRLLLDTFEELAFEVIDNPFFSRTQIRGYVNVIKQCYPEVDEKIVYRELNKFARRVYYDPHLSPDNYIQRIIKTIINTSK